MSKIYGTTFQVAYVVPDLDAAIEHWTTKMGVGPFFEFPIPLPFEELAVREEKVPNDYPVFAGVGVSYSGDTMIELIQPGSADSTYREFLESGQSGIHHFGTFVEDYDAVMADARARGVPVLLEGKLPLSRFAYLDTAKPGLSPIVEIIQPYDAMFEAFDMIRGEVRNWDGKTKRKSL
ncbi:VOC family protein [Croceicoccus gelatinilyticus]|uniref:VOC family protein n=1 Tax=Croceicoccus gelatinilyticus TaxID=2835536 RepID=UPI001BCF3A5B|nr:VOC family protein [Croceicoccus gelatinilyticus]MBS7670054.1 VOC family protein [Croceicoccus gelatinilyticus]